MDRNAYIIGLIGCDRWHFLRRNWHVR